MKFWPYTPKEGINEIRDFIDEGYRVYISPIRGGECIFFYDGNEAYIHFYGKQHIYYRASELPKKYRKMVEKGNFVELVPVYGDKAVIRGSKYPVSFLKDAFRLSKEVDVGVRLTLEGIVTGNLDDILKQYKRICDAKGIEMPNVLPEECLLPSGLPIELFRTEPLLRFTSTEDFLEDESFRYWVYTPGILYNLKKGLVKKIKRGDKKVIGISPFGVDIYKKSILFGNTIDKVKIRIDQTKEPKKLKLPKRGVGQNLLSVPLRKLATPSGVFDIRDPLEIILTEVEGRPFFDARLEKAQKLEIVEVREVPGKK